MSIRTLAPSLTAFALLAACTSAGEEFPSLERRPYESDNPVVAPEAPAPAPVTLPAGLSAKVDSLAQRHRAAQANFANTLPSVQAVAIKAAGSATGSESWVNAHLQLSRLDKLRTDSVAVVRDFDSLIADQGTGDPAMVPLLTNAQKPVADDVAAQNDEINRLSRLIGE